MEAKARAEEERKRRRITVALAASVLLTAGVVGGGWSYLARQQQRRAAQVDLALREAELRRDDAERTGDDLCAGLAARDAAQAVATGGRRCRLMYLGLSPPGYDMPPLRG